MFPTTYYPAYSKPAAKNLKQDPDGQNKSDEDLKLDFYFKVNLKSSSKIQEVSYPQNCGVTEQS